MAPRWGDSVTLLRCESRIDMLGFMVRSLALGQSAAAAEAGFHVDLGDVASAAVG